MTVQETRARYRECEPIAWSRPYASESGSIMGTLNAARSEQRKAADPVEIGPLSRYDRPPPTLNHYDRLLGDQPSAVAL